MRKTITAALMAAALAVAPHSIDAQQRVAGAGGPRESIEIRGNWTIDVREKDGRLASRHEFRNHLAVSGPGALAALLSGDGSVGGWYLALAGTYAVESNNTRLDSKPAVFKTLLITNTGGTVVLKGTVTAQQDGPFSSVNSGVFLCPSTVSPAACKVSPDAVDNAFSFKDINTITLVKGQIVQVSVTFTFGPILII